MMELNEKQHGMSLVELLVAMAILGVALVPLLGVFSHALKMTEHANRRTIAENLVRDLQEEIRSKAFYEPNPDQYLPALSPGACYYSMLNCTTMQPFGCEECKGTGNAYKTSDIRYTKFSDIDDYDGWCEGLDCNTTRAPCVGTSVSDGLCGTNVNPALEDYAGHIYAGKGYAHYQGYTRTVRVFNIFPSISTVKGKEPRPHQMAMGSGSYRQKESFNFFDLREERGFNLLTANLQQGHARGKTNLKIIIVNVSYRGAYTPDFTITDNALMAAPN